MFEDTIIAVSTPLGFGGLGVVRLSGKQSLSIAKIIFKPKNKKNTFPPRKTILGNLYDIKHNEIFEEAYLTFFPAPKSYTTEDVIEFSCHGSPVILEEVVRQGIKAGARHASPGEFTLRAFLGGRIDILQAEAINDLIHASSLKQVKISYNQMEGALSRKIIKLRSQIVQILSQTEASIEFPDEGFKISKNTIANTIEKAEQTIDKLVKSYDLGKTLAEGVTLAITGRSNVGKSTLFNTLLEQERAIVTPHPGTTRDYLRENLKIKDSIFNLVDMAGLYNSSHPAEKEGINRGEKIAASADGILLVLDSSQKASPEDYRLIRKYRNQKIILLHNKCDLPSKMDIKKTIKLGSGMPHLEISALNRTNIEKLKEQIHSLFVHNDIKGKEIILHLRQKLLLEDIQTALLEALCALKEGFPEEIIVEEIRKIQPLIGQMTGEIGVDEILDNIFSRFCIGK
jgi:tRNA modification GTPase